MAPCSRNESAGSASGWRRGASMTTSGWRSTGVMPCCWAVVMSASKIGPSPTMPTRQVRRSAIARCARPPDLYMCRYAASSPSSVARYSVGNIRQASLASDQFSTAPVATAASKSRRRLGSARSARRSAPVRVPRNSVSQRRSAEQMPSTTTSGSVPRLITPGRCQVSGTSEQKRGRSESNGDTAPASAPWLWKPRCDPQAVSAKR